VPGKLLGLGSLSVFLNLFYPRPSNFFTKGQAMMLATIRTVDTNSSHKRTGRHIILLCLAELPGLR
jgi:hypothetical protein